ncbi:DUF1302 family protein [Solimonas sp. K1W22B-7]|uniref:DUF1302 domain-containing protein n=1 Tax=Solimonas sp. K1W22B-7 TaxID=2303331 RepID=UPI000E32E6DF|nr:DUF1302 family protein [Solimonas sp. K1W22B-7]AXQ28740.1 DUF1302 family protein [Solimonas sp. K1W22B-7]
MRSKGKGRRAVAGHGVLGAAIFGVIGLPATASAGSLDVGGGLDAKYNLTLGYAAAMRTESPDSALIGPAALNADDGDRNFDSGSLINNRASLLAEFYLSRGSYGAVLRGDAFYDDVYHRGNDNDSPTTINKAGDNDEFTDDARKYSGGRARVLDAYLYGDWSLSDSVQLNLRGGRQVVAWGESLFFSGIAGAQGPADATKANVPGAEIKNILLPVAQVSGQLDIGSRTSLMAYYHLEYKPTELDPAGSYFSTSDIVGPGREVLLFAPGVGIPYAGDKEPSDNGQYGVGIKVQLTGATGVGLYRLRYHDTNPAVLLNIAEVAPGTFVPVSYNIGYFDGIDMTALSFSTRLGPTNVAGEISYREGVNMLVNTALGPTASRGDLSQVLLSTLYTVAPNFLSQEIGLVGEAGYIHVEDVEGTMGSTQLSNSKMAWGYSLIATLNYRNVLQGWDLAVPITWAHLPEGRPAMAGAFGSLYGEGDRRLSVAGNFTYLQNLQVGVSYNAYLGSATLADRPYADRDYVALNVKYSY